MEMELKHYCLEVDKRFFGLTLKDIRSLVYEMAEKNKLDHRFNKETRLAGKDWVYSFSKRNKLSLRTPEPTSIGRCMGFNRIQVNQFYELLRSLLEENHFPPSRIFNVDETGLSTVPGRLPKVITLKGKRSVNKIVSGERGQTITVVCSFSASGIYVPPAFIFPRKRLRPELLDGAPAGSVGYVSDSGFINQDLFKEYIEHFIVNVKPSESSPVLLILDNHSSHISLAVIDLCRRNHLHLLSIPPHSSHRIQPLDVVFYGPLKTLYSQQCDLWQVSNPGRAINQYCVARIFTPAYQQAASIDKAVKGFMVTGIWPFNPNNFTSDDFLPAEVSERPMAVTNDENFQEGSSSVIVEIPDVARTEEVSTSAAIQVEATYLQAGTDEGDSVFTVTLPTLPADIDPSTSVVYDIVVPEMSSSIANDQDIKEECISSATTEIPIQPDCSFSPVMIRPYPKAIRRETSVANGRAQKASIITSSPFKTTIEEKQKKLKQTKVPKTKKKMFTKKTSENLKRKANIDEGKGKSKRSKALDVTPCSTCGERFCDDQSGRKWIQCQNLRCLHWYHNECQGLGERGPKNFYCITCEDAELD